MEHNIKSNFSLSNLRTIVNVLFAVLIILHNGTVIQYLDTVYVLIVTINSKD
uniref:Uncharacterized protein n=1 Tax=Meloidogyne enterolobii TaxID=390850 RepID=A0A6V7USZ6_MELEN|nr:unnamed protein product [Meloidogyne enterolobii]